MRVTSGVEVARVTQAVDTASWKGAIASIGIFVALFCLTVPETTADTPVYVDQVLTYYQHPPNTSPLLLWEFGHLLWRPLGFVLWLATHSILSTWSGGNPVLEITAVFIGLNFCAGAIVAVLLFLVCRRLGLSASLGLAVTSGFLLFSTMLNYIHSGAPYNLGLAAQLGALLLMFKAVRQSGRTMSAVLAGVVLALSFLLWFPYVLTVPSVLLAGWMMPRQGDDDSFSQSRLRTLAITAVATAVVGFTVFCVGAAIDHISSYAALKQWIMASGHGFSQERR